MQTDLGDLPRVTMGGLITRINGIAQGFSELMQRKFASTVTRLFKYLIQHTTTLFLPSRFALYSAVSASASNCSNPLPGGIAALPILTVTRPLA